MNQAFNPYLPSYEYIPDGEPHVFNGRVYIYGSHDKFNGASFCILDYVSYSAPIDDLSNWRYEGVIFRRKQDPQGKAGVLNAMYAPDVCRGSDGKYYLYYFLAYHGVIGVAVCDTPAGEYKFLGQIKYKDGTLLGHKKEPLQFDPGVFIDDDGEIYLYTGFSPVNYPSILMGGHKASPKGAMGFKLEKDMLTIKEGPIFIGVPGRQTGSNTEFKGHEFFEAASMRKLNGKYYFIYSSAENHELCYAISDNPLGGFKYGGVLVSIGDVGLNGFTRAKASNYLGNTHGSILNINDKYYIFYHRQTNRDSFSRQACAEELRMVDGKFLQAELTSCGLNGGPLKAQGIYSAHIACNLYTNKGTYFCGAIKHLKGRYPYFTQSGDDRMDNPDQYIKNFQEGATALFKYFEFKGLRSIELEISGKGNGEFVINSNGKVIAVLSISEGKARRWIKAKANNDDGVGDLQITYLGKGKLNIHNIKFE